MNYITFALMYAIVDIESTGSPATSNGITEIAIVFHNGKKITDVFETLVNPEVAIPPYVVRLTSITNEMVTKAPTFKELAPKIANLFQDRILVAHNVDFDYFYLKYFLEKNGFAFNVKRLCTFKLSKKAFPTFPKHGLGSLTTELNIDLTHHHRAGADAMATAQIFELIRSHGGQKLIEHMIQPVS